jgi:hypothetical protein
MLNACHLPIHSLQQLWAHTAHLPTLLDIILVKNHKDKSPYELWNNKISPWSSNLRTFGEVGIVQDGALGKIKSKLTNRGFPAIFISYPPNHSHDVFQFLVLSKRSIITSRNVVWLNKTYGDFMQIPVSERSLYIDPIPEYNVSVTSDDYDEDLGIEIYVLYMIIKYTHVLVVVDQVMLLQTAFNYAVLHMIVIQIMMILH